MAGGVPTACRARRGRAARGGRSARGELRCLAGLATEARLGDQRLRRRLRAALYERSRAAGRQRLAGGGGGARGRVGE